MVGTIPLATGKILIRDFFSTFRVEANSLVLLKGETDTVNFTMTSDRLPARPEHLQLWAEPITNTLGNAGPTCFGFLTEHSGLAIPADADVYATTDLSGCVEHDNYGPVVFDLVLRAGGDDSAVTYDAGSATITLLPRTGCDGQSTIPASECAALVEFYYATGGDNWTNNTGWLSNTSPCTWVGVTCESGHVVELAGDEAGALSSNNLVGVLPAGLAGLTELRVLHLGGNEISGQLPVPLGSLDHLELLILTGNQLAGPIPAEYAGLSALVDAQLSHNRLVGPLPARIGQLGRLVRLTLNNNELSGDVPSSWREFNFANLTLNNQPNCLRADETTGSSDFRWVEGRE